MFFVASLITGLVVFVGYAVGRKFNIAEGGLKRKRTPYDLTWASSSKKLGNEISTAALSRMTVLP